MNSSRMSQFVDIKGDNVKVGDVKPDNRMLLFLIILAILQFFGLTFADGNQLEQFSIISRILDESFAPDDFFLNSAAVPGQPRYYYSLLIAWLTKVATLETVVHTLMLINGWALGLISFVAARRWLNASQTAAAVAAMFVVLNHGISIGFAGYLTFSNFQPASIAITASLAGIYALSINRTGLATVAFLFATLMHPTIGAEVGVIGYCFVFLARLVTGARLTIWHWVVALLVFLAGVAVFWVFPNMGNAGEKLSQAEFFSILIETRAPHHYLGLDFPKRRWLEAILFVSGILSIAIVMWRRRVPLDGLTILLGLIGCVVVLCVSSLYFVDIAESRLWATAQLFRLVLLVKWAGYLLLGLLVGQWLVSKELYKIVLSATVVLSSADAISYAVIFALITYLVIERIHLTSKLAILATAPAVLLAVYHHLQYGADDQLIRLLIAGVALLLLKPSPKPFVSSVLAIVLVAAFMSAAYFGSLQGSITTDKYRTELTLDERSDDEAKIALLAKDIGQSDDLWLVPPNLEQFRYIAGRAVIVDFTSVPFEDSGLREWRQRMASLFGDTNRRGFGALQQMTQRHREQPETDLASDTYGAKYAVLHVDTTSEQQVLAEFGKYKIVSLVP